MRAVKQPVHKRILFGRLGVIQHTRQQPEHGIHQHHGRQLAAGQDIVANGDFFIDLTLDQPLIHPFVAPGQQDQARALRQFAHAGVAQWAALRRQVDTMAVGHAGLSLTLTRGNNRRFQRFRPHHHAGTAAIRAIVHGAVIVVGEIPGVMGMQRPDALLQRASGDAAGGQRAEHLREQGDDVDLHRQ